jgi:hypothetical protein
VEYFKVGVEILILERDGKGELAGFDRHREDPFGKRV